MRRLTTDMPENNTETALNLFYIKDGWTWVTGGGHAPKHEDISLCDYVRMIVKEHGLCIDLSDDDYGISDALYECLFDGTDTIEGIVATLYTAGWAFAEIRQRLKEYEDTGLEPKEIKALLDPPNPPLTMEELREMDGEPVYMIPGDCWALVTQNSITSLFTFSDGSQCVAEDWLTNVGNAYRRKPEV